jgi:hypothetical protein
MNNIIHTATWIFMAFSASSAINRASAQGSIAETRSVVEKKAVKTNVFVTSPQLASLVFEALGDSVELYVLLDTHDDAYTYEPTLEDLRNYIEADVILLENRVANLNSQKHIGKKFIIYEHPKYLEASQYRDIDTSNRHIAYNVSTYLTALNILNNEVLTEDQKLENKVGLAEAEKRLDQFSNLIWLGGPLLREPTNRYSAIIAIDGIANPLAEHLHWSANAFLAPDENRQVCIPMNLPATGCAEHSRDELIIEALFEAFDQLQGVARSSGQFPHRVIFLGDEASIRNLQRFTISTEPRELAGNLRYVAVSHNMDKAKFSSYLDWLEAALKQLG